MSTEYCLSVFYKWIYYIRYIDNNNNSFETKEFEQMKNEYDYKNNEILFLPNNLNLYKEKNVKLNSELDKIKSPTLNNDIHQHEKFKVKNWISKYVNTIKNE